MRIDGIDIEVLDGFEGYTEDELKAYVERGKARYGKSLIGLKLKFDGDNVEITYNRAKVPFERVRRITGYLVGTMDRWNDAKTAEEHDRVKHTVPLG